MKKIALFILVVLYSLQVSAADGADVLSKMHNRYAGKWYRTFTFTQSTEVYRNDSLRRSETWYEAAIFPDRFRIDFGAPDSGNAVVFTGDSSYTFRRGKLRATRKDANDLTFLLGGMYFYSLADAKSKMKELGYDLSRSFETTWKGKPVYVIGVSGEGEKQNQLWVEKDRLIVVRFIKYENNRKEEGLLEDHIKAGGGWTETRATFYFDDKLVQKEFYHDFKADPPLDDRLFNPLAFGSWHWFRSN